jgi:hypothetical protein
MNGPIINQIQFEGHPEKRAGIEEFLKDRSECEGKPILVDFHNEKLYVLWDQTPTDFHGMIYCWKENKWFWTGDNRGLTEFTTRDGRTWRAE